MRPLLPTDGPPQCFGPGSDWQGYLYEARKSGEMHTICDDCSARYRARMQDAGQCDQGVWMQIVINMVKRVPVTLPPVPVQPCRPGRQTPIRAALLGATLQLQEERKHLSGLAQGATVREIARRADVGLSAAHKYVPLLHEAGLLRQIGAMPLPHTARPVRVFVVAETVGEVAAG